MPSTLIVPRRTAMAKKIHHSFVRGIGYINHGAPPELDDHVHRGSKPCSPPVAFLLINGTHHLLRPPSGGKLLEFVWSAAEQAWEPWPPHRGNRLAWTPAHLSKAGWAYVGAKHP
jgi:hypothetical protein